MSFHTISLTTLTSSPEFAQQIIGGSILQHGWPYNRVAIRAMTMRGFLIAILLLLSPFCAPHRAPLTYSKETIKIVPKPQAPKPEAEKEESAKSKKEDTATAKQPSEILPTLPRIAKEFVVEMRPVQFLTQKDFIMHQPFGDKEGMLIAIDPPQPMPLTSANLLGKVDVLLVKQDGLISQIAPNVSLRELDEPIDSGETLRAFIFLKAGTTKTSDIQPGDRVEGALFKTHPILLEAPVETKPPPQK